MTGHEDITGGWTGETYIGQSGVRKKGKNSMQKGEIGHNIRLKNRAVQT